MADPQIVYQVRAIDAFGNERVVHAYLTEDDAKNAIAMMKKGTRSRYKYVGVPNDPNAYWGVNQPALKPNQVHRKK